MLVAKYHGEVLTALAAIGDPQRGDAIRRDRSSALEYLGIGFPALRARVKQGFSFSNRADAPAIWAALWQQSAYGDVLFAAIEALAPIVRRTPSPALWMLVQPWHARVDNWCHSDALAGLYSRLLEACFHDVYPQLEAWSHDTALWPRRLSITSLVHYTGKNAVFLPAERMLPLLQRCVNDHRPYIQLALGWVMREMLRAYPTEALASIEEQAGAMSSTALRRAVEKLAQPERQRLLALRR